MKKVKISLLLLLIFSAFLIVTYAADGKGIVDTAILNIRSGPGTNYSNIGQLSRGSEIAIVKAENQWLQIRLPQGLGWVSSEYIKLLTEPAKEAQTSGVINSNQVNIRKEANTESAVLTQLNKGQLVDVVEKKGEWYKIKTGSTEGWVAGFLITIQGSAVDTQTYYINQSLVNMRSEPNLNANIITQLKKDTAVTAKNQKGDWYQVQTKEGQEGWVAGWLLSLADGSSLLKDPSTGAVIYPQNPEANAAAGSDSAFKVNDNVVIKESLVNVRQGPGIEYGVISQVKNGQNFTVIDVQKDWLKVRLDSGNAGWLADWLVLKKEDAQESQRQDIEFDSNESAKISMGNGKYLVISNKAEYLELDILPLSIEDYRLSKPSANQIMIDFPELTLSPQKVFVNQFNINYVEVMDKKLLINFKDKIDFRAAYVRENQSINIKMRNYLEALSVIKEINLNESSTGFDFTVKADKDISYESQRLSLDHIAFFIKGSRLDLAGKNTYSKVIKDGYELTAKQDSQDVVRLDLKFVYGSSVRVSLKDKSLGVALGYPTQGPKGKVVVIDPGHGTIKAGGWVDTGATGLVMKVKELDVNIAVSLKVEEYLKAEGVSVIVTHRGTTNRDLYDRANLANNENAYCFVSIHSNSTTNKAVQGAGVFFYAPEWMPEIYMQRMERQNLARLILDDILKETGRPSYGIFEDNFAVIRETKMPSVLVEMGFLSNQQEEALLADPNLQARMARGIANGILKFLNQ